MITEWQIGDRVRISKESYQNITNANRSIHAYPSDSYVAIAYGLMKNEVYGTVTMQFRPGYEVLVEFDNKQNLQVKDHWIQRVTVEEKVARRIQKELDSVKEKLNAGEPVEEIVL
jgi:hypothetical protein